MKCMQYILQCISGFHDNVQVSWAVTSPRKMVVAKELEDRYRLATHAARKKHGLIFLHFP